MTRSSCAFPRAKPQGLQRDMNMTSVKARQAILAGSQPERREVAVKAWKKTWENVGKDIVVLDELAPKWILQGNRDRLEEIKRQLTVLQADKGRRSSMP